MSTAPYDMGLKSYKDQLTSPPLLLQYSCITVAIP